MRKCVSCGKGSLFTTFDADGYCIKCADRLIAEAVAEKKRIEAVELESAVAFHNDLISIYQKLPNDFKYSISSDPEEIKTEISIFNELLELLPKYADYARFDDAFRLSVVGTSNFREHEVFKTGSVFVDYKNDLSVSDFMSNFIQTIKTLRDDYANVLFETDLFNRVLRRLHSVPVSVDADKELSRKSMSSFPDVSLSNMTKRTPDSIVSDFVVIDVETTGLKPSSNEIIQISAIRFDGGYPCECFNTFVKPLKGLNPDAQRINGIKHDNVANAPEIQQVIGAFENFIGKTLPLVGHNILFDLKFLHTHGSTIPGQRRKFYDTCTLAKKAYPDESEYSLQSLCSNQLRIIRVDAHNSLSDCLATGELFKHIKMTIDYA